MKKRIVTNALCSWAEAVALSAGEDIDFCGRTCSEATIEVFQNIRQVSKHALLVLQLHHLPCQQDCWQDVEHGVQGHVPLKIGNVRM